MQIYLTYNYINDLYTLILNNSYSKMKSIEKQQKIIGRNTVDIRYAVLILTND